MVARRPPLGSDLPFFRAWEDKTGELALREHAVGRKKPTGPAAPGRGSEQMAREATDLWVGAPARGAAARLQHPAPATSRRRSAPAAHVSHLSPAGATRQPGRGQQVRHGWPRHRDRGGAAARGSGPGAPQLGAEAQAKHKHCAKQAPTEGATAPARRPLPGHGGAPDSSGLRSGSRARRQGLSCPTAGTHPHPRRPARRGPASLPPSGARKAGVT